MEPTGKRVDFLRYACAELGLTGVEFAKERAEEAARKIWREQFDVASARAVAALPVLCEYCLPLVNMRKRAPSRCRTAVPAGWCSAKKYRRLRRFTPETAEKLPRSRCNSAKN